MKVIRWFEFWKWKSAFFELSLIHADLEETVKKSCPYCQLLEKEFHKFLEAQSQDRKIILKKNQYIKILENILHQREREIKELIYEAGRQLTHYDSRLAYVKIP